MRERSMCEAAAAAAEAGWRDGEREVLRRDGKIDMHRNQAEESQRGGRGGWLQSSGGLRRGFLRNVQCTLNRTRSCVQHGPKRKPLFFAHAHAASDSASSVPSSSLFCKRQEPFFLLRVALFCDALSRKTARDSNTISLLVVLRPALD